MEKHILRAPVWTCNSVFFFGLSHFRQVNQTRSRNVNTHWTVQMKNIIKDDVTWLILLDYSDRTANITTNVSLHQVSNVPYWKNLLYYIMLNSLKCFPEFHLHATDRKALTDYACFNKPKEYIHICMNTWHAYAHSWKSQLESGTSNKNTQPSPVFKPNNNNS